MSWWDVPFGYRALVALGFLALVSGIELLIRGRRATRWRGSLFLIGCGVIGAFFGMAVDWVTSSISPVYFSLGKNLGEGEDLFRRILLLGIEAGGCAGVLVGCVYLAASHETALLRQQLHLPVLVALACALVAGATTATVVELDAVGRFRVVFAIHVGLYLGGLAGTLAGFHRIRRYRSPT